MYSGQGQRQRQGRGCGLTAWNTGGEAGHRHPVVWMYREKRGYSGITQKTGGSGNPYLMAVIPARMRILAGRMTGRIQEPMNRRVEDTLLGI